MPSVPTLPPASKAGIISTPTGERHIPSSVRADGSKRKEIRIRPGYKPPEDVEVYKNRTAEGFRTRSSGPPPGSEGLKDEDKPEKSASSDKNAKRREARKRAAAANTSEASELSTPVPAKDVGMPVEELDPEAEREKKARNLRKKLKQAKELKEKKEGGAALLPEQFAKVIKINELIRELSVLGFDEDGEKRAGSEKETTEA